MFDVTNAYSKYIKHFAFYLLQKLKELAMYLLILEIYIAIRKKAPVVVCSKTLLDSRKFSLLIEMHIAKWFQWSTNIVNKKKI